MKNGVLISVVALLALGLGLGFAWLQRPQLLQPSVVAVQVGDAQPGFRHPGLDGAWIDADDFAGRALLVNFWATWCAPCVREMPLLQTAAQQHSDTLAVVGIAIDQPDAVREFVAQLGIDYPIAIGGAELLATQRRWGNSAGALPYTVLVDGQGTIRWQHLGEVDDALLTEVLQRWL